MAAPILPLFAVGLGLTAMLVAAGGRKGRRSKRDSPPAAPPSDDATDATAKETLSTVMAPSFRDRGQLQYARDWFRANGYPEYAGMVSSKLASLQAATAAGQAGASREKARARTDWEDAMGKAPSAQDLAKLYAGAMTNTDPGQLRYAWSVLTAYGRDSEARSVMARIERLEGGGQERVAVPDPVGAKRQPPLPSPDDVEVTPDDVEARERDTTGPMIVPDELLEEEPDEDEPDEDEPDEDEPDEDEPAPIDAAEIADVETSPPADPRGTIRLARMLIDREASAGWKPALQSEVARWQARVGLKPDGKFGPKSALRMAEEVGVLPRIRYWPRGSILSTALAQYRRDLNALADSLASKKKQAHAAALRVSAESETGQGYGTPKAQSKQARSEETAAVVAAVSKLGVQAADALLAPARWFGGSSGGTA